MSKLEKGLSLSSLNVITTHNLDLLDLKQSFKKMTCCNLVSTDTQENRVSDQTNNTINLTTEVQLLGSEPYNQQMHSRKKKQKTTKTQHCKWNRRG